MSPVATLCPLGEHTYVTTHIRSIWRLFRRRWVLGCTDCDLRLVEP